MSLNNSFVIVHGYIGKSVTEHRLTKTGRPYIKFSVCEKRVINGKEIPIWFQVSVFGQQAESMIRKGWITQGWECAVAGQPNMTYFTDKRGAERVSFDILANWVICNERLIKSKAAMDAAEYGKTADAEIPDEEVPW